MTTTAAQIGRTIGLAIARDVIADDMPREWTGLDARDGDQLTAAGIEPDTEEWDEARTAAKETYEAVVRGCDLMDYATGEFIRIATIDEYAASILAAESDGGAGVIDVDGRSCYVD